MIQNANCWPPNAFPNRVLSAVCFVTKNFKCSNSKTKQKQSYSQTGDLVKECRSLPDPMCKDRLKANIQYFHCNPAALYFENCFTLGLLIRWCILKQYKQNITSLLLTWVLINVNLINYKHSNVWSGGRHKTWDRHRDSRVWTGKP